MLSDVAEVRDGCTDTVFLNHFDRDTAVTLAISSLEGQNVLAISEAIHRYVEKKRDTLPEGLSITLFNDLAYHLQVRLDMMSATLVLGGLLVALVFG